MDTLTYNAILESVFDVAAGRAIFQKALDSGVYKDAIPVTEACALDLHGFSPGAAVLAVRHTLKNIPSESALTIITGWGRHRKFWKSTSVKDSVCQELNRSSIRWRL